MKAIQQERGAVNQPASRHFSIPVESLPSSELLATIIDLPVERATDLLAANDLASLAHLSSTELCTMMSSKRAGILVSAIELARRALDKLPQVPAISSPTDALAFLTDIRSQAKEHFLCLYLNARNHLIHREVVSIGSLSASIVHPREVLRPAILKSASSIVLAHNHPSGDVAPSQEDIELTRRLVQAGQIIGIEVVDHIIITENEFTSLKEQGLM